ncbi:MAG: hypothetical protein HY905_24420 [Deltaproteobacteria bacterium]|nr:hypothetical protein [Deltaproteobacteria bacterium]
MPSETSKESATSENTAATGPFDLVVVGAALVLSLVGTLLWGVGREALATGLGGTLAVLNWLALRWLGARLIGAKPVAGRRGRLLLGVLFAVKVAVLIAVVWALTRWAALEPAPLALGYSALVVGLFGAAYVWGRGGAAGGADA